MTTEPKYSRISRKIKQNFGYFLVAAAIAIAVIVGNYFNVQELLKSTLGWIDNLGSWKPLAFIVIYNLATVLFIPGSIVTLAGGVIFGVIWGSIYVFIAATLGATGAFLIGRYLSRGWVTKKIEGNARFNAINQAIAKQGFKIVFLTRLSPVFPFNLLNYAFGVTQVALKDYCLGSIGMIPGIIMYVYLGSLAGDIADISTAPHLTTPQAKAMKLVIHAIGFLVAVAVTIYLSRIAKKALEIEI
jgi:uncharacterized membrane protein YdjX (TVP38/TMEM64 family)